MKTSTPSADFDVIILGTGLAGLTLARQLAMQQTLRVLVIDKRRHPAPEAAFKVGESTVEIGAWYLNTVLELADHIRDEQLPKYGLRFFFNDPDHQRLDDGLEIGLSQRFPHYSYQLDRGRLENFLVEDMQRLGVTVAHEIKLGKIELAADSGDHRVSFTQNGQNVTHSCRWVVDATGRAGLLKRQLKLAETLPHDINSVWFRVNTRLRIDDWHPWRVMGPPESANHKRWLSTIHLMGTGYWIWLIPLSSGATSVGIVADPRHHPLTEMNSFELALDWLKRNQPLCGREVERNRDKIMDFMALKRFSYGCKQVFSEQRWALVGEAGMFLDPFYSPGTDFIAFGNTFVSALIQRERMGKPFAGLASAYDRTYRTIFNNTMKIYKDQYATFGNPGVMTVKIIWDYTTYWALIALAAIQNRFIDTVTYAAIGASADRIGAINSRMQAFFRHWNKRWQPKIKQAFLDQTGLPLMYRFNAQLTSPLDADEFIERINYNLSVMEELSQEILAKAAETFPQLGDLQIPEGPVKTNYMEEVWEVIGLNASEALTVASDQVEVE